GGQSEMYARLIHTVDHVEGRLRPEFDALDAFLAHAWAVTVTGAPKAWAMQFIEDHEQSPRAWYGGAVGVMGFDGNLNTGLTLRTIRVMHGVAEVRAGATLRSGFPADILDDLKPHLAVLSPGPGAPSDFGVAGTIDALVRRRIPVFGVCLGLQGMIEYFGGALGVLDPPVHGKASRIRVLGGRIFAGLPGEFIAGRYHSLHAIREKLPAVLAVTAEREDGVVR